MAIETQVKFFNPAVFNYGTVTYSD